MAHDCSGMRSQKQDKVIKGHCSSFPVIAGQSLKWSQTFPWLRRVRPAATKQLEENSNFHFSKKNNSNFHEMNIFTAINPKIFVSWLEI